MNKAKKSIEALSMIVHMGEQGLGVISGMDVARKDVAVTLSRLKDLGIRRMIMLTGSRWPIPWEPLVLMWRMKPPRSR